MTSLPAAGAGRRRGRVAAAAGALVAALAACTGAPPAPPPPVERLLPVLSVSQLHDTLGVNIHATYADTAYGDPARLVDRVTDLGLRHVRDGLKVSRPQDLDRVLRGLADRGVRASLIVGNPRHDLESGTTPEAVDWLTGRGRGTYDVLEGVNEWDCSGDLSWAASARAYQAELRQALLAARRLPDVPLLAPSFCREPSPAAYGADPDADGANAHAYAAGRPPEEATEQALRDVAGVVPGAPVWVTETGYHNALQGAPSQPGVSERAAAPYLLRTYLENARLAVPRTYLYELFDLRGDPFEQEANWGLLRADGTEKPAFVAVRALSRLLTSGLPEAGGASAAPVSLQSVEAEDGQPVRSLTTDAGGGRLLLFVWRPVPVWDTDLQQDLDPGPVAVRVRTEVDARLATADPVRGEQTFTARGAGRDQVLQVGAAPLAVLLQPAAPA